MRAKAEAPFFPLPLQITVIVRIRQPCLAGHGQKVHYNQDIAGRLVSSPVLRRATMTDEEERELRAQLARLQQEHRDLDAAIAALQESPGADILQVQRLKKRKLQLRDRINAIEDQLTPDIIA